MKAIVFYLLAFLFALLGGLVYLLSGDLPVWGQAIRLPIECGFAGGLGGIVYCLRGVYINACVRKSWDDAWQPWYFIRPWVSLICGAISWLFLKAGLLLLDASATGEGSDLGFYALAFIAGLNVDKFISKIEDIAQAAWGIEKSRASKDQGEK